jgi:hypothetical protein
LALVNIPYPSRLRLLSLFSQALPHRIDVHAAQAAAVPGDARALSAPPRLASPPAPGSTVPAVFVPLAHACSHRSSELRTKFAGPVIAAIDRRRRLMLMPQLRAGI